MVGVHGDTRVVKRGEAFADRVLGDRTLARLATRLSQASLRVLAYHDIEQVEPFRAQMEYVATHYAPVSGQDVVAWLDGKPLPPKAVWVTFDDGYPSVVSEGMAVLAAFGIPATMFVCPGVVDSNQPYWWHVVEAVEPAAVPRLKTVPDAQRREEVARLGELISDSTGAPPARPQLTTPQMQSWIDAGFEVGSHTWDHPMLDRCSEHEQDRQIRLAHEWLLDRIEPILFAHPNGNWTTHAEALLAELGYRVYARFDHKLAGPNPSMSRLRVNATEDIDRFRAIVSGVHPLVHRLRGGS
ncbi:MAG: polysaccharide deacetylase family protein [Acidimicrobiia bacterium]|nr:polysaccharide deacetylase family protein [Acidimicrobiia bacterium]MDH5295260.1 polysaccharide deacetylase family protein [Acidimicrobiia bacterium]